MRSRFFQWEIRRATPGPFGVRSGQWTVCEVKMAPWGWGRTKHTGQKWQRIGAERRNAGGAWNVEWPVVSVRKKRVEGKTAGLGGTKRWRGGGAFCGTLFRVGSSRRTGHEAVRAEALHGRRVPKRLRGIFVRRRACAAGKAVGAATWFLWLRRGGWWNETCGNVGSDKKSPREARGGLFMCLGRVSSPRQFFYCALGAFSPRGGLFAVLCVFYPR